MCLDGVEKHQILHLVIQVQIYKKIDDWRKSKAAVYKVDEHGSLYGRDTKDFVGKLENLNVLYVMPL